MQPSVRLSSEPCARDGGFHENERTNTVSYRKTSHPRRRGRALGVLAAGALLALACGPTLALSASGPALPSFSVTVTASSVAVTGTPQSGAVNVLSIASGIKEGSVILFRLNPGVSVAEVEAFLASKRTHDPNNTNKYGSIVFDAEAAPGHGSETQTLLQPGQYLALGSVGEGPPKFHTAFTVGAAASPAALPAPQATIRSIEFGFRGPATLHDGELVRFENEGFLVHMNVAFPVQNQKAAKQAIKLLLAGKEKPLHKLITGAPVGFAGPLSSGAFQQETINAKPGVYVEVCFMETQDKRDHTRLGMERMIKITK
jgi:hypothetical protein